MKRIFIFGLCLVVSVCLSSLSQGLDREHDEFQSPASIEESKAHHVHQVSRPIVETEGKDCFFTGYAEFYAKDTDSNGIFNQLAVSVELQVVKGGSYSIHGQLKKGDTFVATSPFWPSAIFSGASLAGDPGAYMVKIDFSGEEIFRSEIDGPYEVLLSMVGERGFEDSFSFSTPAYEHQKFGEQGAYILSVEDEGIDVDGDGMYNFLKFTVSILIREPSQYHVDCVLEPMNAFTRFMFRSGPKINNKFIQSVLGIILEIDFLRRWLFPEFAQISDRKTIDFDTPGRHAIEMFLPGYAICRTRIHGPYLGFINLSQKYESLESKQFVSRPYRFSNFGPVPMKIKGNFKEEGIDENGDGQYDILRISFDVESNVSGDYRIEAFLKAKGKKEPLLWSYSEVTLNKGLQSVFLDFYGPDIRRTGKDGPYTLSEIQLKSIGQEEIDVLKVRFVTRAYRLLDFKDRHSSAIELENRLKNMDFVHHQPSPRFILEGEFLYVSPFYKGIFRSDDGQEYMVDFGYPERPGQPLLSDFLNSYKGQRVRLTARREEVRKNTHGSYVANLKDGTGQIIEGEIRIAEMISQGTSILSLENYEMIP